MNENHARWLRLLAVALVGLFLITPIAHADAIARGFRGSTIQTTPIGVQFTSPEYTATVAIKINGQPIPPQYLQGDAYYKPKSQITRDILAENGQTRSISGDSPDTQAYKFNFTATLNPGTYTLTSISNLTIEITSTQPLMRTGTGSVTFPIDYKGINEAGHTSTYSDYDVWSFSDILNAANRYQLTAREEQEGNTYRIVLTNFNAGTHLEPGYQLFLDPTVDHFGANTFTSGAFNNTQTAQSQSVYGTYYPTQQTFTGNGTYYSRILVLNRDTPDNIDAVSWAWYEPMGLSTIDNAVMSMHFENDSHDSTRFNNSGFLSSVVTGKPTYNNDCIIGGCYNYNSSEKDFINVTDKDSTEGFNNFTVMAWIKTVSTPAEVIGRFNDYGTYAGWLFGVGFNGAGKLACYLNDGVSGGTCPPSSANVDTGNWVHVVMTYGKTDGKVRYYINGTLDSTVNAVAAITIGKPVNNLYVGCDSNAVPCTRAFNGSIDELHIWNRSLTDSEVNQVYKWEKDSTGRGNRGYIHNFTNVSLALRTKTYLFNDTALAGWWDLGDSSDNEAVTNKTLDLSGNTTNGKLYGNLTLNTSTCVIGQCLTFYPAGQTFIDTEKQLFNVSTDNLTINMWMKPSQSSSDTTRTMFVGQDVDSSNKAFSASVNGTGHLQLTYYLVNSTGVTPVTNEGALPNDGKWRMVTILLNQSGWAIYINGTRLTFNSGTNQYRLMQGTTTLTFGKARTTSSYYQGSLDDIKAWNRTLTEAEIISLYNSGNPAGNGGLESNWSTFSQEYYGGNLSIPVVSGKLLQYRAKFSTVNENYTAFLQNVTVSFSPGYSVESGTITQPMTVYGYFTGANANLITSVTAYIGGVMKGTFNVTTTGQYGLFDVQGNFTDYSKTLELRANNSASWATTIGYSPGNTTRKDIIT